MTTQEHARQLIVDALKLAGAPVRGAAFKLKYLRQLDPAFDERQLGYRTLRAFLEAFPDVVRLSHDGIDIVVEPPKRADHLARVSSGELHKIRPDLWRAFTFVDKSIARYFDRVRGEAVLLSIDPSPEEPERLRELRGQLDKTPANFVPIGPVEAPEQLEQMRGFAASVEDRRLRSELEEALGTRLWFRAFNSILQGSPGLLHTWKIQWSTFVLNRINEWSKTHQIDVPNLVTQTIRVAMGTGRPVAQNMRSRDRQRSPTPMVAMSLDVEDLRARILNAVEEMTLSQLLALSIPAEYLYRNG